MGPYRSTLLTVLTVVLGTVLAACGGGDATPILAPPSPTAVTEHDDGSPVLPTIATKHSKQGAIAFARHYWRVVDYAQATGDVRALTSLTPPTCHACVGGLELVRRIYRAGGHIEGGDARLSHFVVAPLRVPGQRGLSMRARITTSPQRVFRGEGKAVEKHAGATGSLSMITEETDSGWKVAFWSVS